MSSQSLGPKLIAIGFAILVAPYLIAFYLSLGPVGWTVAGVSIILIGIAVSLRESPGYDDVDRLERTNCDACGSRIDADADTCDYCGAVR
ncbi:zinc ribbon domain-containing protein [Natrinema sp. 1APR25-10V2]|uniref:zinc ribbon domain-containing protein n=1 Tax=Natrinema sp. 1APR25-10V2 TaxID=2951081 RepID=UPI0028760C51|nr:zinc ribbon domain-containing protein [Natrinema sp. 1APR25-10V2]MDS0477763.1 zinc ribbon domain-containing protein [Natrinema sp. 1APR25-10V2]